MCDKTSLPLTAAHWGVYRTEVFEGQLRALHPFEHDPQPSAIGQGYLGVIDDSLRIREPMVRKAWLDKQAGANRRRGDDTFVAVSWQEAEQLVAEELQRLSRKFGNQSIYGGSYGWSAAGRFHHAQSQLHRFLNSIGGYTRSVNTYSLAAGEVILSRILGSSQFIHTPPAWQTLIEQTELLVAFGGMPLRNAQISSGGTGRHRAREALMQARQAGVSFVNVSPMRSDVASELGAQWLMARPGSDVAIMLGLAHEILRNNWHDSAFIKHNTHGFDEFAAYLTGKTDGVAKSAAWAANIARIPANEIEQLAKRMAESRTIISVSWSMTRQEHGEQPFWMATTLAAMLGQIGLPGGGIAYGYCAANSIGNERENVNYAALPQLVNPIRDFIPVSRISDMLLNPGEQFRYDGQTLTFPDIRLIYWAGGNPFHHHQDLTRLREAWRKPETIIVHEWCWNASAKHADIVLPCTTPLERDDLMITPRDRYIVKMNAAIPAVGNSRDDYEIFRGISRHLGVEDVFTEGRSSSQWLEWIYQQSRSLAKKTGIDLPSYRELCQKGWHETPFPEPISDVFSAFRQDPQAAPLDTPSGKIEIRCDAIASYASADLLPHPAWYEPEEWLGKATEQLPFHLISSQPADKLHSQLDHGPISRSLKRNKRTPIWIHSCDAKRLGIADGDTVRVHNNRGACLATASYDDERLPGVVQMSTGAWLDAIEQADGTLLCRHGNPNTVTRDYATSEIAQGPTAHSCLVAIEPHDAKTPVEAFTPPRIV